MTPNSLLPYTPQGTVYSTLLNFQLSKVELVTLIL